MNVVTRLREFTKRYLTLDANAAPSLARIEREYIRGYCAS
jgi:hypothetical protein